MITSKTITPLAGLILLAAAQTGKTAEGKPARIFTDEQFGITVAAPTGWERRDPAGYSVPGSLRAAWSPDDVASITVFTWRPEPAVGPDDLQDFLDKRVTAYESQDFEVKKHKIGKLAGTKAMSLVVVGDGTGSAFGSGPVRTGVHWVAVAHGEHLVSFWLTAPEADLKTHQRVFKTMLRTLKLTAAHPERTANLGFEQVVDPGGILEAWDRCGTPDKRSEYVIRADRDDPHAGRHCARIERLSAERSTGYAFGGLTQSVTPDTFRQRRLRYTGYLRTQDVGGGAVLWLRVDGPEPGKFLAFDNMGNRQVRGTTPWQKYEIVLDVPPAATKVIFGALLDGGGTVWVDDLQFEVVGTDTPLTAPPVKH